MSFISFVPWEKQQHQLDSILDLIGTSAQSDITKCLNKFWREYLTSYDLYQIVAPDIILNFRGDMLAILKSVIWESMSTIQTRQFEIFGKSGLFSDSKLTFVSQNFEIYKTDFINRNVDKTVSFIVETTIKEIKQMIEKFINENQKKFSGICIWKKGILSSIINSIIESGESRNVFRAFFIGFTETHVSMNESQTKINCDVDGEIELYKRWISMRDNKVRQTHQAIDSETQKNPVPVKQPFIVGGYPMMNPGDRSAPEKEWVGCRCWDEDLWKKTDEVNE